jgi:hypothetical protein
LDCRFLAELLRIEEPDFEGSHLEGIEIFKLLSTLAGCTYASTEAWVVQAPPMYYSLRMMSLQVVQNIWKAIKKYRY